jgi:hypothetical protein
MDLAEFYRCLADAVAWCVPRASETAPGTSLRTPRLHPRPLSADRATVVGEICHSRRRAPRRSESSPPTTLPDLAAGRLLAYFPDADLSDGMAELETGGFFDVFNAPPWDTWVAFFEDPDERDLSYRAYLVAYVPPTLLNLVERGIYVNPEECIAWLADTETGVARILRETGAPF